MVCGGAPGCLGVGAPKGGSLGGGIRVPLKPGCGGTWVPLEPGGPTACTEPSEPKPNRRNRNRRDRNRNRRNRTGPKPKKVGLGRSRTSAKGSVGQWIKPIFKIHNLLSYFVRHVVPANHHPLAYCSLLIFIFYSI